jgi:hypothetical protein
MQSSIYELLKMVVIVLGIFTLLYLFKSPVETLVNFDKIKTYNSDESSTYSMAPPSTTFQEGAPIPEIKQQDILDSVVVGADTLKADELLPKYDDANEFAKQNPITELLKEQNYLIAGYHLGISSTMQSSKIPYYDIRSLPAIPRDSDWPINNSSIERSNAFQRRPLDIGN